MRVYLCHHAVRELGPTCGVCGRETTAGRVSLVVGYDEHNYIDISGVWVLVVRERSRLLERFETFQIDSVFSRDEPVRVSLESRGKVLFFANCEREDIQEYVDLFTGELTESELCLQSPAGEVILASDARDIYRDPERIIYFEFHDESTSTAVRSLSPACM